MWENLNHRLSKLNVFDIAQVKWASLVFGIIIAKLFPQVLQLNYVVLIGLVLVFSACPIYKFWIKN